VVITGVGRISESLPPGGQLASSGIVARLRAPFAFYYGDRTEQIGRDSGQACVVRVLGDTNYISSVVSGQIELRTPERGPAWVGAGSSSISVVFCRMVRENGRAFFLSNGIWI
jgi:hypothetical protein